MKVSELSVVMPFYNEGKQVSVSVKKVLNILRKSGINFELVLIDNNSVDNTKQIIQQLAKVNREIRFFITEKKGYGLAVRTGLEKAKGRFLGWIDGDGQFEFSSLIDAYNKLKNKKYDLCKGIRKSRKDGSMRTIASIGYTLIFNILFFNRLKDINGKPKIMTREVYSTMNLRSNDWFIDAEVLLQALKNKNKICDVSLDFSEKAGKSSINIWSIKEFIINLLKTRFGLK